MTDIDRELAERVMRWTPPEVLPEGRYTAIEENEEFGIGPIVGWRHNETNKFYSNKEWKKYEYWTTEDGEPAKAPWGGLVHKRVFYKWTPSTDISQAFKLIDIILKRDFVVEIYLSKFDKPEVMISYGEDHPNYPNSRCRESGDERVALVEAETLEMAICLAILKL